MPTKVKEVYDLVQQRVGKGNGYLLSDFNRLSKLAELRFLYWITGDIRGGILPDPYTTQKDKDFVSPFIVPYKSVLDSNSQITKPNNYYAFDNLYYLTADEANNLCDEDDDSECGDNNTITPEIKKRPIQLLDGQQYNVRSDTSIESLKPINKPIAKQIGNKFEFLPDSLQGVCLEYIRYPIYAEIVTVLDEEFNDLVIDEDGSTDYEWDEKSMEILVWIITDFFSDSIREAALKNMNNDTGKTMNK